MTEICVSSCQHSNSAGQLLKSLRHLIFILIEDFRRKEWVSGFFFFFSKKLKKIFPLLVILIQSEMLR